MTSIMSNKRTAIAKVGDAGWLIVARLHDNHQGDHEGRIRYQWQILNEGFAGVARSLITKDYRDEIKTGINGFRDDPLEILSSLCSFLLASAEARDKSSENWTLFRAPTRRWAKANADALQAVAMELNPEEWKG